MFAVSSASLVLARLAEGRLRQRHARRRGAAARRSSSCARAIRAGQVDRRAVLGLARTRSPIRFRSSLLYDRPVRELVPERAVNTAILAVTGAHHRHLSSDFRSASLREAVVADRIDRDSNDVDCVAFAAPVADVAGAGVHRGAHRLVSDRGDSVGRCRYERRGARSRASPRSCRRWRWRCRWRRSSSGCRRRRWARSSHEPFILAALARGVGPQRIVLARRG